MRNVSETVSTDSPAVVGCLTLDKRRAFHGVAGMACSADCSVGKLGWNVHRMKSVGVMLPRALESRVGVGVDGSSGQDIMIFRNFRVVATLGKIVHFPVGPARTSSQAMYLAPRCA
jgi:hypothetical protein